MTVTQHSLHEDACAFAYPRPFADPEQWKKSAARLRAESPVHWFESDLHYPFWILSKHAHVKEVSLHNDIFLNEPRSVLATKPMDDAREAKGGHLIDSLIALDGEHHKAQRGLAAGWFRPSNLRNIESRLDALTAEAIGKMEDAGGECDFAVDIAQEYPLQTIMSMMGLPKSDYPRMIQLTQELFGASDPDVARDENNSPEAVQAVVADFFEYFARITADRRANPTNDFCSVVANAEIDGKPLEMMEQMGLYIIMATAGHDTTSFTMSGGLKALAENPDQLARLQAEPELMATAVDEMIRWSTPVKHFMRTATEDYELGGKTIAEGQDVLLSYWSANFDEDVFENPEKFDVGRKPNGHLALGFGAHYCLGAILAKMQLTNLFTALVPRLKSIEVLDGANAQKSPFVSGYNKLPIRYELT